MKLTGVSQSSKMGNYLEQHLDYLIQQGKEEGKTKANLGPKSAVFMNVNGTITAFTVGGKGRLDPHGKFVHTVV